MKPFLILQLRPEPEASDNEFAAILQKGGLTAADAHRIRLDVEPMPAGLKLDGYSGVIVGGGPGCVSDPEETKSAMDRKIEQAVLGLMPQITERDFPFMGCCYGIGILGHHLGVTVSKQRYGEPVGAVTCTHGPDAAADPLCSGLPDGFRAFVGHKEALQALPGDCAHLLQSETCPYQMIRYRDNVYATQFHPEADAEGFEVRIRIYRDKGYFPPDDAERLKAMCRAEDVHVPEAILRGFVERYAAD